MVDRFKSRELRASRAAAPRNLYTTEWRSSQTVSACADGAVVLVGARVNLGPQRTFAVDAPVRGRAANHIHTLSGVILAVSLHDRKRHDLQALAALEATLALIKTQTGTLPALSLYLLTHNRCCPALSGQWGLARSARAELMLPLNCIDGAVAMAMSLPATEPEAMLHRHEQLVPRLVTSSSAQLIPTRLHFHQRGAISNLYIEPDYSLRDLADGQVLLSVRAVGLNFRDVLNVLGEYPGDPGPLGGDVAGQVINIQATRLIAIGDAAFGVGYAPLACSARAAAALLALKPTPPIVSSRPRLCPSRGARAHVSTSGEARLRLRHSASSCTRPLAVSDSKLSSTRSGWRHLSWLPQAVLTSSSGYGHSEWKAGARPVSSCHLLVVCGSCVDLEQMLPSTAYHPTSSPRRSPRLARVAYSRRLVNGLCGPGGDARVRLHA